MPFGVRFNDATLWSGFLLRWPRIVGFLEGSTRRTFSRFMAVSIRLRREGTKNSPYYKIVVADSRSPRDGKFIEIIGNYDPRKAGDNANVDIERADYWIKNGAQPSDTVRSIINRSKKAAAAN
jgi:small subunit ribosomal protein S16